MLMSLRVVFVLVTFCVICDSDILSDSHLEKQSIFYGLVLTASENATDSDCIRQLVAVEEGIRNKESWAIKLLDASGHPDTGFYFGNNYWLGSEVQCSLVNSLTKPQISPYTPPYNEDPRQTTAPFPVSYYAAYFYHNSTFQILTHWDNETKVTLGLCIPSSCEEEELGYFLQEYFDSGVLAFQQLYNTSFKLDNVHKTRSDFTWMSHPIAILFLFCTFIIAVLVLLGTLYDLILYQPALEAVQTSNISKKESKKTSNFEVTSQDCTPNNVIEGKITSKNKPDLNRFHEVLLSFSWYTNFSQVFTMEANRNILKPIIGFRALLTIYVIISHSRLFVIDYYSNRALAFYLIDSFLGQILSSSSYSIDVFFLIGGFLMVHGLLKSKELADESNHSVTRLTTLYLKTIFKRFRRLTPTYMYVLGMTFTSAANNRTSVAMWTNERNDLQCSKYWWTNLLYINNIFPGTYSGMCMSWSYYLSSDMQFFAWIAFLFYLSKKYFKTAAALLIGTFVGSLAALGIATYVEDYKPFPDTFYVTAPLVYYPPWMRVGPYIIGACYGYLYNALDGKLQMKKVTIWALWTASLSTVAYIMVGFFDKDFPTYFSVLFSMFSRNIVALAVGWIIFACLTGHGGAANTMFSAKGWMPFSNLAYAAYLLNPLIIYLLMSNSDHSIQIGVNSVILTGMGLVGLSFLCSIFLVISVEYPMDKVMNIFFDRKPKKKLPQSEEDLTQKKFEKIEENTKL